MILDREQRMAIGAVTSEEIFGQKMTTEEERDQWKRLSEEATFLSDAEQVSKSFEAQAIRLLHSDSSVTISTWIVEWTKRAAAYAEAHPWIHSRLDDPLRGLGRIAENLSMLSKPAEESLKCNSMQAKQNALAARDYEVPDAYVEEEFERCFGNDCAAKLKEMLVDLASRCRSYQVVARMRLDALIERARWQAETEARVLETKADDAEARGDPKQGNELRQEAGKKRDDSESRIERLLHQVLDNQNRMLGNQDANSANMAEIKEKLKIVETETTQTRQEAAAARTSSDKAAADSRTAARAATRAETAAKNNQRAKALDADLVDTFKDMDNARKDPKNTGLTEVQVAEKVMGDAKRDGRLIGNMSPKSFVNAWTQWGKWHRPEAEAYTAKKRPRYTG